MKELWNLTLKYSRAEATYDRHNRNMGVRYARSKSNLDVGQSGKCNNRYVYCPSGKSQLTCLIFVSDNSS